MPLPPLPLPPPPVPPPPGPPSTTAQPNAVKVPTPDSRETDNIIAEALARQRQTQPPTARPNPVQGGAPQTGGNPKGDITATLSQAQRGAIGDKVRECWTKDPGALDLEKMQVMVTATLDPRDGTVRDVVPAEQDRARVAGEPRLRAFFERARRAILDPRDGTVREVVPAEQDRARVAGEPRLRAFFERARRAILDPRCGKELVTRDKLATTGPPTTLTFRFSP